MTQKFDQLITILETPLTHIEAVYASSDEFFRIEGRVPWCDEEGAEDNL
jgi:hypothetical protein